MVNANAMVNCDGKRELASPRIQVAAAGAGMQGDQGIEPKQKDG
jgi:hypothetical protein